ncbi:MAG: hypothetical protein AAGK02_14990, partial [Pseudomonadota bacterium]
MLKSNSAIAALVSSAALLAAGCASTETVVPAQMASPAPVALAGAHDMSITVLEFGGPDVLFAADQASNKVIAFELEDLPDETSNLESVPYNLTGLGRSLATHLGVSPFDIAYRDLAVHPVTKAAFLSLSIAPSGVTMTISERSGPSLAID